MSRKAMPKYTIDYQADDVAVVIVGDEIVGTLFSDKLGWKVNGFVGHFLTPNGAAEYLIFNEMKPK